MKPLGFRSFFLQRVGHCQRPLRGDFFLGVRGGAEGRWERGELKNCTTCPDPLKSDPLPFKRAGPARRTKVGGEAAPFPLRHPFRFHVRRFPQRLRPPVPPPPPPRRSLTCGPDRGTSGGGPGPPRRGRREGRAPAAAGRERGPGRGRGRAPSQRPPARGTQPLSAASRAHKPRRRRRCVRTPRAPRPRPSTPLAAGGRGDLGRLRRVASWEW